MLASYLVTNYCLLVVTSLYVATRLILKVPCRFNIDHKNTYIHVISWPNKHVECISYLIKHEESFLWMFRNLHCFIQLLILFLFVNGTLHILLCITITNCYLFSSMCIFMPTDLLMKTLLNSTTSGQNHHRVPLMLMHPTKAQLTFKLQHMRSSKG